MKKIIILFVCFICCSICSFAEVSNEYTKEIDKFSKALSKSNNNIAAKEKLINNYELRGDKYLSEKEWGKAANDYRSALFYMKYYNRAENNDILNKNISNIETKLENSVKHLSLKNSSSNIYYMAYLLEQAEQYPAAGYLYIQAGQDHKLIPQCKKQLKNILKNLNYKNSDSFFENLIF